MTREEAIKWLNDYLQNTPFQMEQYEKAFEMAIKALEQEPCDKCKYFDGNSCQHYDYKVGYTQGYEDASNRFRQEPCDDAISREAVNTLVDELARAISDERCCISQRGRSTGNIMHDILELPSVTPSRRKGHWIKEVDFGNCVHYVCSECKNEGEEDYCPNCGAKMETQNIV